MRINKFVAQASRLSRRKADEAIAAGRVQVNGHPAAPGQEVGDNDTVTLDGRAITPDVKPLTIMLNKPAGYVVSRNGQGSKTIYDLLPPQYQHLQPIGRLDKDSSGLLLLTNDGQLANELTHPSHQKIKVYQVTLDKPLAPADKTQIEQGIKLEDGLSKLEIRVKSQESRKAAATLDSYLVTRASYTYEVRMHEGRNRQIRRTFQRLGYQVITLHRTQFGAYQLGTLRASRCTTIA